MNEQEFLCIIKHKVPEVQKRIFSILKQRVDIIYAIERELSANERIQLYGADFSPKKSNQEPICMILLIKGNTQIVQKIIGTEGAPHLSPLNSIRYMYGETGKESGIDYWNANEHIKQVKIFFTEVNVHVA